MSKKLRRLGSPLVFLLVLEAHRTVLHLRLQLLGRDRRVNLVHVGAYRQFLQVGEVQPAGDAGNLRQNVRRNLAVREYLLEVFFTCLLQRMLDLDDIVETRWTSGQTVIQLVLVVRGCNVDDVRYLIFAIQQRKQRVHLALVAVNVLHDAQQRHVWVHIAHRTQDARQRIDAGVRLGEDGTAALLRDLTSHQQTDCGLSGSRRTFHEDAALVNKPHLVVLGLVVPELLDGANDVLAQGVRQSKKLVRLRRHLRKSDGRRTHERFTHDQFVQTRLQQVFDGAFNQTPFAIVNSPELLFWNEFLHGFLCHYFSSKIGLYDE